METFGKVDAVFRARQYFIKGYWFSIFQRFDREEQMKNEISKLKNENQSQKTVENQKNL